MRWLFIHADSLLLWGDLQNLHLDYLEVQMSLFGLAAEYDLKRECGVLHCAAKDGDKKFKIKRKKNKQT